MVIEINNVRLDRNTRVVVQGITGRMGSFQTKLMIDYGTNVVAGVTPGKGGMKIHGVPVYDTIFEAKEEKGPFDVAIAFVPPGSILDSCIEAVDAGVKLIVVTTADVPYLDAIKVIHYANKKGAKIVGPEAAGILVPHECKLGVHPVQPDKYFTKGPVGIVSRSGSLSYDTSRILSEAGIGQSAIVCIGGGPIWGTTMIDVIESLERDKDTEVILMLGEIGGTIEEETAEYIKRNVSKPVTALIVGRYAPPGKSMGHASAIIMRGRGTWHAKVQSLRNAGVHVAKTFKDLLEIIQKHLKR
ncbi:succinate--CoA ligase subunit alpha [Candidatus Aerophobetes bacterium]|uniref:Succinate--CoA ligase subunit alpha n=1 Tax=Aerophobetes bacterium TaxID=2030807 RepID=A0A497E2M9_UNCAE|nr:MAG: succinate--CoA ligase subunit alpha [Candidatus Aerophobetes bacterium]